MAEHDLFEERVAMFLELREAESYDDEVQVLLQVFLTQDDLVNSLKGGELIVSEWLRSRGYEAEFRVIVQGKQVGVSQDKIIHGL